MRRMAQAPRDAVPCTRASPARELPWWAADTAISSRRSGDGHAGDRPRRRHPLRRLEVGERGANDFLSAAACHRPHQREREGRVAVAITATVPGTGDGGTTVAFNTQHENQRRAWRSPTVTCTSPGRRTKTWLPGMGGSSRITTTAARSPRSAAFNTAPKRGAERSVDVRRAPAVDSSGKRVRVDGQRRVDAGNAMPPHRLRRFAAAAQRIAGGAASISPLPIN